MWAWGPHWVLSLYWTAIAGPPPAPPPPPVLGGYPPVPVVVMMALPPGAAWPPLHWGAPGPGPGPRAGRRPPQFTTRAEQLYRAENAIQSDIGRSPGGYPAPWWKRRPGDSSSRPRSSYTVVADEDNVFPPLADDNQDGLTLPLSEDDSDPDALSNDIRNIYPLQDGGPVDLGPQRPHGQFPPGVGPAYAVDLGPQRPHGQVPPGSSGPPGGDLGPQRPHGQFPPSADVVDVHRLADDQRRGRPDKDLGPHRPAGLTDPNGPPGANGDLGPQRPSGQFPPGTRPPGAQPSAPVYRDTVDAHKLADDQRRGRPDKDLGPHRPAGLTDPNGPPVANCDLGPQRPSGQFPPGTRPPMAQPAFDDAAAAHKLAGDQRRGRPDKDLGPHRPAGLTDPNGPPGANGDLGPQRPSGQFPPGARPPPSQTYSAEPTDLGPQRPHGQFPPSAAMDDDDEQDGFRVFWNVPSFMCHRYGFPFSNLSGSYGIVQNDEDVFRGSRITILYDPGLYPALVDNDGTVFPRNGGVPQEGNLTLHLQRLQESIEDQVPVDFDGLGVIDFEAWRPVWGQNFGTLKAYQTYSIQLERTRDPTASDTTLQNRAKRRFEAAAKAFFLQSLFLAQRIRPNGRWGYYAFPYCFNSNDENFDCSDNLRTQNSQIQWLFNASTALFPSVYLSKSDRSSDDQFLFITGKLREALRVAQGRNYVYPYFWYRYRDAGFLSDDDLRSCLAIPRAMGMAGAIVWGSSGDMNNQTKCQTLDAQLESRLGPTIRKFSVTLSNERVRQYVAQRNPNSSSS